MRVLLVEDEKKIADSIVKSLRSRQIETDWISSGPAALLQIKQFFYDVVVLDLMLPWPRRHEYSGIAAARRAQRPRLDSQRQRLRARPHPGTQRRRG
ncbi:MAG: response regulator [Chthoniobacteraceae bacterium]